MNLPPDSDSRKNPPISKPGLRFLSLEPIQNFLLWINLDRWHITLISVLAHLIVIFLLGQTVLFVKEHIQDDFTSESGFLVGTEEASRPPGEPSSSSEILKDASAMLNPATVTPESTMAPLSAITTTSATQVYKLEAAATAQMTGTSLAAVQSMAQSLGGGGGLGGGMGGLPGGGTGGGTGRAVSFFGVKTKANRIAFLIDYSGSMTGPMRLALERELTRSLKELPDGTEVVVIPWAGAAWLFNELPGVVSPKWTKHDPGYWTPKKDAKIEPPIWIKIDEASRTAIMSGVLSQKNWSGGTDWRSPFWLAMRADPPPDTIFFMTDGQIFYEKETFSEIEKYLARANPKPKVFSIMTQNIPEGSPHLKKLANRYGGEYRVVADAVSTDKKKTP